MFRITVTNSEQETELRHHGGAIELGRSPAGDGATFTIKDACVSRRQLRVEQVDEEQVRLENLGADLTIDDRRNVRRGESHVVSLPIRVSCGFTRIELSADAPPEAALQTILQPVRPHSHSAAEPLETLGGSPSPEQLARWFETLLSVQQSAAGSRRFYEDTARAVVGLVGLDRGIVVLLAQDHWQVAACHARDTDRPAEFSHTVLDRVVKEKRTFYETEPDPTEAASLASVESFVASPIINAREEVIGVVFGSRDQRSPSGQRGIQRLEAQVIQLLAGAVSAGVARVEQEAEAARLQVQLEQFASPELVRELTRDPNLLEPIGREMTVLFGDLRGFTQIGERLSPRNTFRLVSDVMERLTACIVEHGGFVIDYSGDGIGAMWNAPAAQADHAQRACLAAVAMQLAMPELSDRWRGVIGRSLVLGIGINTGVAQVGNAGSRRRLKYGPLGHTINLASRVEGATKQLGIPALVTASTRDRIDSSLVTRRLCQVRVVGVQQPVTLYELHGEQTDEAWLAFRDRYEQALSHYEAARLDEALGILDELVRARFGDKDRPTELLHTLASRARTAGSFEPVLNLDSK